MSSTKEVNNGLFIFRRDYRITDNNGLSLLNTLCKNVFPVFIFTPEQVGDSNTYKSDNAVQFMIESLIDLQKQIHDAGGQLYTFYGDNLLVIKRLIKEWNIDIICCNCDYTPYAIKRDLSIIKLCKEQNIAFTFDHDYYLHHPNEIQNATDETYKKFTPYYTSAMKKRIEPPKTYKKIKFAKHSVDKTIQLPDAMKRFTKINPDISVHGGRTAGLIALKTGVKEQQHYSTTHNLLVHNTSKLSAYIKFGCVSIREVYHAFKHNHDFIRQLIWRDFYANILYSYPQVLGHSLKPKFDTIKWSYNNKHFEAWKKGLTGYPVVDAGMRELNATGYMHNRSRLIVASFLIKTLLIDWRKGEKYFASNLTDYDVASNNGNWQWIFGGGADSQPYFRIFNPWLQSKEYDKDAEYITKWIPELASVDSKDIHKWNIVFEKYPDVKYPKPIVVYETQKQIVLDAYKKIF